jgi:hypothetical protein|tara:strand:+ start:460 stop:657 length:198 start_codon:yes stop_codon:yes gene_type:complete
MKEIKRYHNAKEGLTNNLGGELLSDGEVLDLVYAWASENEAIGLQELLQDNEEEDIMYLEKDNEI